MNADAAPHSVAAACEAFVLDISVLPKADTASIRQVRRALSARLRDADPTFLLDIARALARRPGLRWVAYELIRHHQAAFRTLDDGEIAALAAGLESWDSVDSFGRILSGPAWAHGLAGDGLFHRWAASPDRWLRRAALVSTVALNMPRDGGRGDAQRTLDICRRLAADRDDMVIKALSWALRALAVRDPAAVRSFLAANDRLLAARVRREVASKLESGLKNPKSAQ